MDFMEVWKRNSEMIRTENGAAARNTSRSAVYDMFATGGSYRQRSDEDITLLFHKAYNEDKDLALKCLFYLRDIREGQGERRFFKTAIKFLATDHTDAIRRNLKMIPVFGRWDDLYALVDTPLEDEMFKFMYEQLCLDLESKTPSLLGKRLK